MLNVLITVDTEAWPIPSRPDLSGLQEDVDRDIYGTTAEGQFGIPYQIDCLNEHGLKGVFFVESLYASAVGDGPLRRTVNDILKGGQDVQLHLHTEWLWKMKNEILPNRYGQHIRSFSEDEQVVLIKQGIENLRRCGVSRITAFRAGNFGASFDTLRALARCGIPFDTSYNVGWLGSDCDMVTDRLLLQPCPMKEGVYEFPVSFFQDYGNHYRPTHIIACSEAEMEHALLEAWRHGWKWFVIVTHSFELIHRRVRRPDRSAIPDRVAVRRFESLCRFLEENADKFRTRCLSDVDSNELQDSQDAEIIRSSWPRTGWRIAEQLYRRWKGGQLLG